MSTTQRWLWLTVAMCLSFSWILATFITKVKSLGHHSTKNIISLPVLKMFHLFLPVHIFLHLLTQCFSKFTRLQVLFLFPECLGLVFLHSIWEMIVLNEIDFYRLELLKAESKWQVSCVPGREKVLLHKSEKLINTVTWFAWQSPDLSQGGGSSRGRTGVIWVLSPAQASPDLPHLPVNSSGLRMTEL